MMSVHCTSDIRRICQNRFHGIYEEIVSAISPRWTLAGTRLRARSNRPAFLENFVLAAGGILHKILVTQLAAAFTLPLIATISMKFRLETWILQKSCHIHNKTINSFKNCFCCVAYCHSLHNNGFPGLG